VTSNSLDSVASNNTLSQMNVVNAGSLFDARVTMVPNKLDIIGGEEVIYAVTVTNDGPSDTGPLNVNFPLQPREQMDFVSAVATNAKAQAQSACVSDSSVQGTGVICTINNLAMGETATWDVKIVPLPFGLNPAFFTGGVIVSEVGGPGQDTDSLNNSANPLINVRAGADVSVVISQYTNLGAISGGKTRHRVVLTLRNDGPAAAKNIRLTSTLPANLDNPSVTSTGADCTTVPHGSQLAPGGVGFIDCIFADAYPGPLARGGQFDWSITVDAAGSGNATLEVQFNSGTEDPNPGNNTISKTISLGGGSNSGGGSGGGHCNTGECGLQA